MRPVCIQITSQVDSRRHHALHHPIVHAGLEQVPVKRFLVVILQGQVDNAVVTWSHLILPGSRLVRINKGLRCAVQGPADTHLSFARVCRRCNLVKSIGHLAERFQIIPVGVGDAVHKGDDVRRKGRACKYPTAPDGLDARLGRWKCIMRRVPNSVQLQSPCSHG